MNGGVLCFFKIHIKKSTDKKTGFCERTVEYQQSISLLTTLEYKVFMLMREGFSKKECAQRLNMRRSDIKKYVKSIFFKLNVRSSAELIVKYR